MKGLSTYSNRWILFFSALFIFFNIYALYQGIFYFSIIPIGLLLVYGSFYYTKEVLFFVIACTPLSLNLESLEIASPFDFYLPTEPILFGLSILILFSFILRKKYSKSLFKHPITHAILFYLAWLFITSITSERPIVSFKFLVSKLWFIIPLYFYATSLFKNYKNIYIVQWLYLIPLCLVVSITIIRHYGHGFDQEIAHWIMSPFFKDHTSYGAIVAFFIPICISLLFRKGNSASIQLALLILATILIIGLLFSYTRAAWLSLLAALIVYGLFHFKIHFKYVLLVGIVGGGILLNYQNEINMKLSKNKTDSSANLSKHVKSISNISTDASNLERLNRWNCAIKMFEKRPFFGWGGGTYAFEYAPFQHSSQLTIISTNFGNKGNAHSEYLGSLAETGIIGLLSLLILLSIVFYKASILYLTLDDINMKWLILGIILALTSYFTHAFLNNYLDTDKASVPIWLSFAIITALDLNKKSSLA